MSDRPVPNDDTWPPKDFTGTWRVHWPNGFETFITDGSDFQQQAIQSKDPLLVTMVIRQWCGTKALAVVVMGCALLQWISGCGFQDREVMRTKVIDDGSGAYPSGDYTGTWEVYWPNGQLKYIADIIEGKEHGTVRCYWDNGQLAQVREMDRGAHDGESTDYYENGTVQNHGVVRGNHLDGVWREYYPTGDFWKLVTWNRGQREGRSVEYHINGETIVDGVYRNDEPYEGTFRDEEDEENSCNFDNPTIVTYRNGVRVDLEPDSDADEK